MHLPANMTGARHQTLGATTGSSSGTTITAGGSANTKGSYSSLGATSFAFEGFTVYFLNNVSTADFMIDIAVGSVGNETILIQDLYVSCRKATNFASVEIYIPVHVLHNQFMQVRCAASSASASAQIIIVGHSANPGGYPGFARAVPLFTAATSRGVAVDCGGTANTKGSWTEIIASTPVAIDALLCVIGCNGNVARTTQMNCIYDIGVGGSGSEYVLIPDLHMVWDANSDGPINVIHGPMACRLPSGTRLAARSSCNNPASDVAGRVFDIAPLGLVA